MSAARNEWLLIGGSLSFVAALMHLACIAGGADWYRALGAGEPLARMVERGRILPHLYTACIAAVLAGFGTYALSGAGVIRPLPLLRWALLAITFVYLARGLLLFAPQGAWRPDLSSGFKLWSSAIVLGYCLIHLIGLVRGWSDLKGVN